MKAIILAAGRGSRLGARTEARPKCLAELRGAPLLHWQLAALRTTTIDEVVVVGGYRIETLTGTEYTLIGNPRWSETNMVGTLARAASYLRAGPTLVSYSDIVYHPRIVEALSEARGDIVVTYDRQWRALWTARFPDPLQDAERFRARDGRVVEIGGRASSLEEIEGQYMGLLKFSPAGWEAAEQLLAGLEPHDRDRLDMTGMLQRLLQQGVPVDALPVDGGWCEVDSEEDLVRYESLLARAAGAGTRWSHDWR